MTVSPEDTRYLKRTLALAQRAPRTSPNPRVGSVVVRDGVVVGEGYHHGAGTSHAEVNALRTAGERARGATLYVSLEPCAHHGRMPPCCPTIIAAGITRVVCAAEDVNPLVAGRGLAALRKAGITVECGALAEEEARMNAGFRYWILSRRPYVTLKAAVSLDGKLATVAGESQWITGEAARRDVHRMRAEHDAILTTAATVLADNPALTARLPRAKDPRRVVLDSHLRTSPDAQVYAPAAKAPILATAVHDEALLKPFRARGVEVLILPVEYGHIVIGGLLKALGERDILSLMVECGGTFAGALLAGGYLHRLRMYVAPLIIGGDAPGLWRGVGLERLADAWRLTDVEVKRVGERPADRRQSSVISHQSSVDSHLSEPLKTDD